MGIISKTNRRLLWGGIPGPPNLAVSCGLAERQQVMIPKTTVALRTTAAAWKRDPGDAEGLGDGLKKKHGAIWGWFLYHKNGDFGDYFHHSVNHIRRFMLMKKL